MNTDFIRQVRPTPVEREDAVLLRPTGGSGDAANMQAAANEAAASGAKLVIDAGDLNLEAADVMIDDGPELFPGDPVRSGVEFLALAIEGKGKGRTRIRVGPGRRGIVFATDGRTGKHGSISGLSVLGTGINAGGIGIQLGGISSVRSDLLESFVLEDIEWDNLTSCLIADDVTWMDIIRPRFGRFKFGCEWGYNVDDMRMVQASWGYNDGALNGVAATITSGSNVIVLPPGVTSRLQVGYAISTGSQKCFPRETYVGSISGNTITTVNFNGVARPALANGTSINFFCGRCVVFGASTLGTAGSLYPSVGSPFVSPYWSTANSGVYANQRGRIGATNHVYEGAAGSIERFLDIGGPSHSAIRSYTYLERTCEGYEIGDPGSTGLSPGPIFLEGAYWGFKQTMAAPVINVISADLDMNLIVRGNFSDSPADDEPWIQATGYGSTGGQLTWEDNRLPGSRTAKFMTESNTFAAFPAVPPGGAMYLGTSRGGDAMQTWTTGSWHYAGQDGFLVDLSTGSKTMNNPADRQYGIGNNGKMFTIYLTAGADATLTLGNMFRNINGTAIDTIAAGAPGSRMILRFLYDAIGGRFLLQTPAQWVA